MLLWTALLTPGDLIAVPGAMTWPSRGDRMTQICAQIW